MLRVCSKVFGKKTNMHMQLLYLMLQDPLTFQHGLVYIAVIWKFLEYPNNILKLKVYFIKTWDL